MCDKCTPAKEVASRIAAEMTKPKIDHAERVREYYRKQGEKREQERIIRLIESIPFIWMGDVQLMQVSRDEVIDQIKGKVNG